MNTPYKDKSPLSSTYRAVLMFRTVGLLILAVAILAAAFPQMDTIVFSLLCLVLMLPALVYQIRLDRTLIHSGRLLSDDGASLCVVTETYRLGFGRRHHMRKTVRSYRVCQIRQVLRVRAYPFGIAVKAAARTAAGVEAEVLDDPARLQGRLMETGKERMVLLRLERSLQSQDEEKLLQRLHALAGPEG